MITVNSMWPPSVQNHLKYLFMYKIITDENTKNSEKSIIKKAIVQNCGWWKNFDCIFGFSVKSYVRNKINLSCAKTLLTSVTCIQAVPKLSSGWIIKAGVEFVSLFLAQQPPPSGPGPPHSRGFWITHDASQTVELLWTSDQAVAETSTW